MAWMRQGDRSPPGPPSRFFVVVSLTNMALFELVSLLIFTAQQLGVVLGVGAQTILLIAHLLSVHGVEHGIEGAAKKARGAGLALIILSGAAAVGLHVALGAVDILLEPAFLFKWALIAAVLLLHIFETR